MLAMRITKITALAASTLLAAAPAARAATCTITAAQVRVASHGLSGVAADLVGKALPTTIDEASGAFVVDCSGVAPTDFSLQGLSSNIALGNAGVVSGTIDRGGNVVLPNVAVGLTTGLAGVGDPGAAATLTSGLQAVALADVDLPSQGKPLDFVTGTLKIGGQATATGFELACTLVPVPAQAGLPKANTLGAHGHVKRGASDDGSVVGDTLALKATVKRGATTPLDPAQDVLVRLAIAGESVLLLRVPAGTLAEGRKRVASDDDGSIIRVVTGRKSVGDRSASVSGRLTVTVSKKKLALKLVHTGGDLSAVTGATSETKATISVAMGPLTVTDEVTIEPGKKKTSLK
jgi:hypothetical protein